MGNLFQNKKQFLQRPPVCKVSPPPILAQAFGDSMFAIRPERYYLPKGSTWEVDVFVYDSRLALYEQVQLIRSGGIPWEVINEGLSGSIKDPARIRFTVPATGLPENLRIGSHHPILGNQFMVTQLSTHCLPVS